MNICTVIYETWRSKEQKRREAVQIKAVQINIAIKLDGTPCTYLTAQKACGIFSVAFGRQHIAEENNYRTGKREFCGHRIDPVLWIFRYRAEKGLCQVRRCRDDVLLRHNRGNRDAGS